MKKVLSTIGYLVLWFILFNVAWYIGGIFAFSRMPEEITLKYLLWAGISDFLIFDSIMIAIGAFPIVIPALIFKKNRIAPLICSILAVAHCVLLVFLGGRLYWAYIMVSAGALMIGIVAVANKKE